MSGETLLIFLGLVFFATFLLTQSIVIPTFGISRQESRRLRKRLNMLADKYRPDQQINLVRDKYLKSLSPLERKLESLPGMSQVEVFIERSGHRFPAYLLLLLCVLLAFLGGVLTWFLSPHWWFLPVGMLVFGGLPAVKLKSDLVKRMLKFEEQLPEALDIMTSALRAGYPFNESLYVISTDMDDPIASEFRTAFEEINFGEDLHWAMDNLLERIPSMSLVVVVTMVLVQRDTGGNLAETFENISKLIRGRFRFHRRVQSMTAEARMSAWILVMIPFALFAMMSFLNPGYVSNLTQDPMGGKIIMVGLALQIVGILWIKKLISMKI